MDDDYDPNEWIYEALGRPPLRVMDDTTAGDIAAEVEARIEALLVASGCEPTPDGWRRLAVLLALRHEPAFKIETPVDRASKGGRPIGWSDFLLRSRMRAHMRDKDNPRSKKPIMSAAQAARLIHRETPEIAVGTAKNALSRPPSIPDDMALWRYKHVAEDAAMVAAKKLSQE